MLLRKLEVKLNMSLLAIGECFQRNISICLVNDIMNEVYF